ncbi:MAG: FAD-dependent oxidoreductase [Planctomycetota bacterium]
MKIAIIGAGISGLVCAHRLHAHHNITIFEANSYPGGHTNTADVLCGDRHFAIDTGFIVFNDRTYPNFIKLLDSLGVESQPTIMSFSVKCERTGLEYRGADFKGLFAQKRNLVNPRFLRLLYDLVKFNREAGELVPDFAGGNASGDTASGDSRDYDESETLKQFISRKNYSRQFVEQFLLPMGSAIWSCPFEKFEQFPIEFIAEFYRNHGLLSVTNRPQWRVIKGGSREYVRKLIVPFEDRIRLDTPVRSVVREADQVVVSFDSSQRASDGAVLENEKFDHVIFACHADQALRMLSEGTTRNEREILSAFPYERNIATLHTQEDVLPKARAAWAAWNYFNPVGPSSSATVTYNMNILQSLETDTVFNVTLNDSGRIREENVIEQFTYHHPTFDLNRKKMQRRHAELIGANRSSFCGAYWGNGFHEDGVNSAIAVADWFDGLTDESESGLDNTASNPAYAAR